MINILWQLYVIYGLMSAMKPRCYVYRDGDDKSWSQGEWYFFLCDTHCVLKIAEICERDIQHSGGKKWRNNGAVRCEYERPYITILIVKRDPFTSWHKVDNIIIKTCFVLSMDWIRSIVVSICARNLLGRINSQIPFYIFSRLLDA